MANNIDASFPEYWSKRMQIKMCRENVFMELASFEEESMLSKGDKVHRPYRSNLTVNDMGAEGSYTRQDVSDTDESLTVDKEKEVSFYLKKPDEVQSNYAIANEWADDAGVALSNGIDGDVLSEVANAGNVVDAADFGGTSGEGIVLTTSNVFKMFLVATKKLDRRNAPQDNRIAILSPDVCAVLKEALINRETPWGDQVGERGYIGMYDGYSVYKSNGVYCTAQLYMATQPTDGDTVTLNLPNSEGDRTTITFTLKDVLTPAAGEVLIGGSADAARANLATLITTPGTTTANGVALSAANQALLKDVSATNDNGTDILTLVAKGKGNVIVGETLTDVTLLDMWTPAKQIQHNVFAVRGCVDVVIQIKPTTLIKERDGYIGKDIVSYQTYGYKTFAEGARRLVDVKIRANTFTA